MLSISNAFRSALDRQIRPQGHCDIWFFYTSGGSYHVPEELIKSVETRQTGDPLARSLPTEQCTISLIDFGKLWYPGSQNSHLADMADGAQANVRFGIDTASGVEWSDTIMLRLKGRPTWSGNIATFQFVSALSFITATAPGISDGVDTLGDLAEETALGNQQTGSNPYNITTDFPALLDSIPVLDNATMESKTVPDTLLAISFASFCAVKTANSGAVTIRDYFERNPLLNPAIIKRRDILDLPQIEQLPTVNLVVYTYLSNQETAAARESVLDLSGDADVVEGGTPITVSFKKQIAKGTFQFDPATNVRSLEYLVFRDHIAITKLTRTDSTQPFVLTGTGIPASTVQKTSFSGNLFQQGDADEEISNPLLNTTNCVGAINTVPYRRLNYLRKTKDLFTIQFRGDPSIEALDIIRVELEDFGIVPCIVVDVTFRFEDGFSGSISVRRIDLPYTQQTPKSAISDLAVSDQAYSDMEV